MLNGTEIRMLESMRNTIDKLLDNNEYKPKVKIVGKSLCEPIDEELAEEFYELVKENQVVKKKPNLEQWANDMRLMRMVDNIKVEVIRSLMAFAVQDNFWKSNILSPRKLRKHADTLYNKASESFKTTAVISVDND